MKILIPLLLLPVILLGQESASVDEENHPIISERPGVVISANVVGKKTFQFEAGYALFQGDGQQRANPQAIFSRYNTSSTTLDGLLRVGLSENLELRLGGIRGSQEQSFLDTARIINSISPVFGIGLKYRLLLREDYRPGIALLAGVDFYPPFTDLVTGIDIRTVIEQQLPWNLLFTGVAGLNPSRGNIEANQTLLTFLDYVANLSFPLNENITPFIEYYGGVGELALTSGFDAGFAYLLSPDFQLDFSAGYDINYVYTENIDAEPRVNTIDEIQNLFFSAGISYQLR